MRRTTLRVRSPFTPKDIFCQRRMSSMESADYPHMKILIDLTGERPTVVTDGFCVPQSMGAIASIPEKRNCAEVAVISGSVDLGSLIRLFKPASNARPITTLP